MSKKQFVKCLTFAYLQSLNNDKIIKQLLQIIYNNEN